MCHSIHDSSNHFSCKFLFSRDLEDGAEICGMVLWELDELLVELGIDFLGVFG